MGVVEITDSPEDTRQQLGPGSYEQKIVTECEAKIIKIKTITVPTYDNTPPSWDHGLLIRVESFSSGIESLIIQPLFVAS